MKTIIRTVLATSIILATTNVTAGGIRNNYNDSTLECKIIEEFNNEQSVIGDGTITTRLNQSAGKFELMKADIKYQPTKISSRRPIKMEVSQENISEWQKNNKNWNHNFLNVDQLDWGNNSFTYNVVNYDTNYGHTIALTGYALSVTGLQVLEMHGSLGFYDNSGKITFPGNIYFECGERPTASSMNSSYQTITNGLKLYIAQFKDANLQLKQELRLKDITIADQLALLNDVGGELGNAQETVKFLNKLLAEQTVLIESLNQRIIDLQTKIEGLLNESTMVAADAEWQTIKNGELANEIVELKNKINEDKMEVHQLSSAVDWYIVQNGEYHQQIDSLQSDNDRLNAELATALTPEEVNSIDCTGGAGSLGLGLSIIGLIGLARRKMK